MLEYNERQIHPNTVREQLIIRKMLDVELTAKPLPNTLREGLFEKLVFF